jgi:hypothetical protein
MESPAKVSPAGVDARQRLKRSSRLSTFPSGTEHNVPVVVLRWTDPEPPARVAADDVNAPGSVGRTPS